MSRNDNSKRVKCCRCYRRRDVERADWREQEAITRELGAAELEIICGHCFDATIADTDGYTTDGLTAGELLAESLIPPAARRWRWIHRYAGRENA